jgi:hypothetical protein
MCPPYLWESAGGRAVKLPSEPWWRTFWREVDAIQEEKARRATRDQNTQIARAVTEEVRRRGNARLSQVRQGFKRWRK